MKTKLKIILAVLIFTMSFSSFALAPSNVLAQGPDLINKSGACKDSFVFGIPTWYKYLKKRTTTPCQPKLDDIKDITLILLAILETLTKVSALLALGYLIWGGIKYTTSQGSPEGTKSAKDTILNAIIGLVITLTATTIVVFIGQRIG